jgi:cobalt-zinc-cadmium resistance protein CzcA
MIPKIVGFSLTQRALMNSLGIALLCGGLFAFHNLDIIAYPDPSPPMIEVITPAWGI